MGRDVSHSMSDTHTDREYAYVAIQGPSTHEDITQQLGIQPTEFGNVGDLNPRTGRPYRFVTWIVQSGLDDTHSLDEHINALLLTFARVERQLRELWVEHDIVLCCVGRYPSHQGSGFNLDREQLRRAACLGFSVDFDFYFVDCGDDG